MLAANITGLVVGGLLAQRFRVLVLIPTTLTALLSIAIVELIGSHTVLHALLQVLSMMIALQIGYFFGSIVKRIRPEQAHRHDAKRSPEYHASLLRRVS